MTGPSGRHCDSPKRMMVPAPLSSVSVLPSTAVAITTTVVLFLEVLRQGCSHAVDRRVVIPLLNPRRKPLIRRLDGQFLENNAANQQADRPGERYVVLGRASARAGPSSVTSVPSAVCAATRGFGFAGIETGLHRRIVLLELLRCRLHNPDPPRLKTIEGVLCDTRSRPHGPAPVRFGPRELSRGHQASS